MPIVVRPATPADIPALCRMKRSLLALEDSLHVGTASESDWRRDGFGPNATFNALIAEVDDAAAGMATFSRRGFPGWAGSAFFLHDLYVEETHRRRGIARALMAHLAGLARAEGVAFIELTVDKDNKARKFYERVGFAHVSRCMSYIAAQPAMQELAETISAAAVF
jgi:GNAT superfamily N-acetyltransferase